MGTHRPAQDAVFLFASEYPLSNYVLFIESLRATGYTGDIVLTIHPHDWNKTDMRAYFTAQHNLIVYAPLPICFTMERDKVDSAKGGMRTCQFNDMYGTLQEDGSAKGVPDPRPDRTFANIRYELYWLAAVHYDSHAWILLIDFRDAVFQSNPFSNLPRQVGNASHTTSGRLYFFGENREATRIGRSKQNNKWIRSAYGDAIGDAMATQPTICSGATMGEQVAIETYLRAMVAEADETGTVLMGSDQGFHNRLYYSGKLSNALSIREITVFDQGTGIVNNMGALRTKPLAEWGNGRIVRRDGNDFQVLNWDGNLRYVRLLSSSMRGTDPR
jgi:hypothetical protein